MDSRELAACDRINEENHEMSIGIGPRSSGNPAVRKSEGLSSMVLKVYVVIFVKIAFFVLVCSAVGRLGRTCWRCT